MTPALEPSGVHETPTGLVRYAIWHWHDADGLTLIPCGVMAALDDVEAMPGCCGDRVRVVGPGCLLRVAVRGGLLSTDGRFTERGAVVRSAFRRRELVKAGVETAHGLRRCAADYVAWCERQRAWKPSGEAIPF